MQRMIVSVVLVMAATAHAEDSLDRAAISDGIAKVKAKVMACQASTKTGGSVKVAVTVGPDGKVTKVIRTANDKDLGAASRRRSKQGQSAPHGTKLSRAPSDGDHGAMMAPC